MGEPCGNEKIATSRSYIAIKHDAHTFKDYKSAQSKSYFSLNNANFKAGGEDNNKQYELDDIPVKDFAKSNGEVGTGDSTRVTSLTNSFLDRLEQKVRESVSQELQTDDSSVSSFDSHIKFFRTTVQEIFDTFYSTLNDIESYKARYNEILSRNTTDKVNDMEEFIKDIIHHIVSSDESNASIRTGETYNICKPAVHYEVDDDIEETIFEACSNVLSSSVKNKQGSTTSDVYKSLTNEPSVDIRLTERYMQSEINVRAQSEIIDSKVVSADNLKKVAAKRKELEEHEDEEEDDSPDRDIPIKISSPKKNLPMNEDFHIEQEKNEKSFIYRLCSYFCKKIRKNAFNLQN